MSNNTKEKEAPTLSQAGLKVTPVFMWNWQSKKKIRVNCGGSSSGKTYAILQVICLKLIEKRRIATVIGQDVPNLKRGALRDFQDRILYDIPQIKNHIKEYNKNDRIYTFSNGSTLEFTSYEGEQDARSGKRDIAFFNEGNGIDFLIYQQIAIRTEEEIYIDFNPSARCWVHDKLQNSSRADWFYSNFTHNPFCSPEIVAELKALKRDDPAAWEVYGLGKTGSVKGLIFPKYTVVESFPMNARPLGYGLDFGYSADPTSLVRCGIYQGELFIEQLVYKKGMTNADIAERMTEIGIPKTATIVCDSAEPKSIEELRRKGFNVKAAKKGRDSIIHGISLLSQYKINVTRESVDVREEMQRYRWKEKDGQPLNQPIDKYNHAIDAIRYWASLHLLSKTKKPGIRLRETPDRGFRHW